MDVAIVRVKKDSYVEIFADQAIGRITKKEAEFKTRSAAADGPGEGTRP